MSGPSSLSLLVCCQGSFQHQLVLTQLIGRNHPFWPVDVPHNFNVLDYFYITDVWAELNAVVTKPSAKEAATPTDKSDADHETKMIRVFCFRLEKANLQKHSWWDPNPTSYVRGPAIATRSCTSCNQDSKEILQAGWACLNHNCDAFFKDSEGKKITNVSYNDVFLQERTEYIGPIPSIVPSASVDAVNGIGLYGADLYGSEAVYRSGIVCSCGSCTSRVFWNRWSCEHCGKQVRTQMVPYPKDLLKAEADLFNKTVDRLRKANRIPANTLATKLDMAAVKHREVGAGLYKVSQFLLPDGSGKIIGSVTVLRASQTICERGPDKMFDTLSVSDIGLRRNAVSGGDGKCSSAHTVFHILTLPGANEGLSRHFGINWVRLDDLYGYDDANYEQGAPYKFGVTVDSKGFSDAPETILQAVQQMRWAGTTAVPMAEGFIAEAVGRDGADVEEANVDFNECLSLGYMESDMIHVSTCLCMTSDQTLIWLAVP